MEELWQHLIEVLSPLNLILIAGLIFVTKRLLVLRDKLDKQAMEMYKNQAAQNEALVATFDRLSETMKELRYEVDKSSRRD